jgi:hydrogenase maturation factor
MTLAYGRRMAPPTPVPSCDDQDFCLICSDEAVPVRVVELLDAGMARVDTGISIEEVCIELVEAAVGDTILVHAKVAIGKV